MAAEDDGDVDAGWDEEPVAPPSEAPGPLTVKPPDPAPKHALRLGEGGETAKLLANPGLVDVRPAPPRSAAVPGGAPPFSRKFTPKVTNAVQQAKDLDSGVKPIKRPTPMRVPSANADVGAAPAPPELPAKLPTTSLRFNERGADGFPDLRDIKLGKERRQTLKLNRAAQDLAVEISNDEADVYSRRGRDLEDSGSPTGDASLAGDRISAPALDLHLDDLDAGRATPKPGEPPVASLPAKTLGTPQGGDEKPPTTARSAGAGSRPAAVAAPAIPPPAPSGGTKTDASTAQGRLAPPRAPTGGLRSTGGFRAPAKPKDAAKPGNEITRLDTPSSLSMSIGMPTQPPPAAIPTPVPPGFDEDSPVVTFDAGADVEVSITDTDELDSLEIDEFEAAEAAKGMSLEKAPSPKPARLAVPRPAAQAQRAAPQAPKSPADGPASGEPPTVRGGPDDDPEVVPIRERFERRDYMGALMRAEALLAKRPDHAGAKFFASTCQDRVKEMYVARLGSGASVPRLVMAPDELQALSLDHRSGFLISLIDGCATVDDVLDISGMPMIEALRLLFELKNEGVIDT